MLVNSLTHLQRLSMVFKALDYAIKKISNFPDVNDVDRITGSLLQYIQ